MRKKSNFTGAPRTMGETWFQRSPTEPGAAIEREYRHPKSRAVIAWIVVSAVAALALIAGVARG